MKSLFVSMVAVLLGFALYVAPEPAKADPIDCTNGCDIVTCRDGYCQVWHCDSGGCIITGGYEQHPTHPQHILAQTHPAAFDAVCNINGNQACAIKACENGSCTVSLFDRKSKSFVPIGETNDINKLIDKANAAMNR